MGGIKNLRFYEHFVARHHDGHLLATDDGGRMGSRILHSAGARLGEHMITKAQIDRIATRIEALAPNSDRVVYVWRNWVETEEEALERQFLASPADRFAGQTYIFSWIES